MVTTRRKNSKGTRFLHKLYTILCNIKTWARIKWNNYPTTHGMRSCHDGKKCSCINSVMDIPNKGAKVLMGYVPSINSKIIVYIGILDVWSFSSFHKTLKNLQPPLLDLCWQQHPRIHFWRRSIIQLNWDPLDLSITINYYITTYSNRLSCSGSLTGILSTHCTNTFAPPKPR